VTDRSATDYAAWRLQRDAWSLIRAGRGDDAIAVTERLVEIFATETNNDLRVDLGDRLLWAASALAFSYRAGLSRGQEMLMRVRLLTLGRLSSAVEDRVGNRTVAQRRRRLLQAVRIDDMLIAELAVLPDAVSHRAVTEAKINRAGSLVLLGSCLQGVRALAEMIGCKDPAYAEIAARTGQRSLEQAIAVILDWAADPHPSRGAT
jgi:hypothetical protein